MLQGQSLDARIAIVDEHVRAENGRDLEAVMATFGSSARYDDEPWADHRSGRDAVRDYYAQLLNALPDLVVDVGERHVAAASMVLEVEIRGTHLGRRVDWPAPVEPCSSRCAACSRSTTRTGPDVPAGGFGGTGFYKRGNGGTGTNGDNSRALGSRSEMGEPPRRQAKPMLGGEIGTEVRD